MPLNPNLKVGENERLSFHTSSLARWLSFALISPTVLTLIQILSWPGSELYYFASHSRRGRIIGSAAVLKTADRKVLQVRVLSPPPLHFNNLHASIDHLPSVPVASWRDFGALLEPPATKRSGKGPPVRESTAIRRFSGMA